MTSLRPYQKEAIDAVFDYWSKGGGNPLVDMATGTGKSVVIANLVRQLVESYPSIRVLMLVHVRELVGQNANAMLRTWPQAPVGINSAGLGRRDKRSQILFASIQSVAREDAGTLGDRHVILVDEAHLIPQKGDGQYRTLIGKLRGAVPDLRVIGFTATPYRLDSGRLDDGDERLFTETVYSYDIGRGVEDGYLSPLVSRATGTVIDVSGVKRAGGEFVAGALEAAANRDVVTQAACDEIVARGADRRAWLAFCAGVDHAHAVRDALRQRGVSCETITGETASGERDRIIRAFREGQIKCLTNANVLTTGFDAPIVDMIAMLRPTLSTALYVQMLGRGTRLAEGKQDCLVLDFALNVRRHGPVDSVSVGGRDGRSKETVKTEVESVKAKTCPNCEYLVSIRSYECPHCGHEWPRPQAPAHQTRPDTEAAVMTRELANRWLAVDEIGARIHRKEGSPDSMRVEYFAGATEYREWVTIEHPGFAGARAAKWWAAITGRAAPDTSEEAVERFRSEVRIEAIIVRREGQYWRVSGWRARRPDGRLVEIDERLRVRPALVQTMKEAS